MVERAPIAPIVEKDHLLSAHETVQLLPTAEQATHSEADRAQERLEQSHASEIARDAVEDSVTTTNPLEQFQAAEAAAATPAPTYVNADLKAITLRRELKLIQRQESAAARTFSRAIHQPAIRLASEAAGKTVSRPSGLLGAGVLAFIGSSSYLYLTKHYGFSYNYFVVLALFAGGFGLGLLLELAVWATVGRRRAQLNL